VRNPPSKWRRLLRRGGVQVASRLLLLSRLLRIDRRRNAGGKYCVVVWLVNDHETGLGLYLLFIFFLLRIFYCRCLRRLGTDHRVDLHTLTFVIPAKPISLSLRLLRTLTIN
jgi:hypothetical protein